MLSSPCAVALNARSYLPDEDRLQAYQALQVAARVHAEQRRRDGQPFVTHPVAVAKLVAKWGMDGQCVAAALLHDAVEDTPLTFGEVEAVFGPEVRTAAAPRRPRPRALPPRPRAPRLLFKPSPLIAPLHRTPFRLAHPRRSPRASIGRCARWCRV